MNEDSGMKPDHEFFSRFHKIAIPEGLPVESLELKTANPPDFRELVDQAVVSPIRADIKLEPWPPPAS